MERASSKSSSSSSLMDEEYYQDMLIDGKHELRGDYIHIRPILGSERVGLYLRRNHGFDWADSKKAPMTLTDYDYWRIKRNLFIVKTRRSDDVAEAKKLRQEADLLSTISKFDKLNKFHKLEATFDRETDDHGSVCIWIAIRFPYPCITLSGFIKAWQAMSESTPVFIEFVSHVFVELCDILRFLDNDCHIAHNAIDGERIVLHAAEANCGDRFPYVKLVDFDKAEKLGTKECPSNEEDWINVGKEIRDLIQVNDVQNERQWLGPDIQNFMNVLKAGERQELLNLGHKWYKSAGIWRVAIKEKIDKVSFVVYKGSKEHDFKEVLNTDIDEALKKDRAQK